MNKLLVFLTDPLEVLHAKGEIKARYYNPCDLFEEIHFLSPAAQDIEAEKVQPLVGTKAKLVIHSLGRSSYYAGFLSIGLVATVIKRIRPDVIRAYDATIAGSLAVLWARRLHVPSVLSLHADLDDQRKHEKRIIYQFKRCLEYYALSGARQVVCVSDYLVKYAEKYGAKHVRVIYNKVYSDQYHGKHLATDNNCRDSRFLKVLSVGRLVPSKGQDCLIRAITTLNLQLVLIGSGVQEAALRQLVSQLNLSKRVEFIPVIPNSEIHSYYEKADIFAIATKYEGFCIPVLEAMAASLPVVASRIPAIEEVLGNTGILVDTTPSAFCTALKQLMNDVELRASLGQKARNRAVSLDGKKMERREAQMYEALATSALTRTS